MFLSILCLDYLYQRRVIATALVFWSCEVIVVFCDFPYYEDNFFLSFVPKNLTYVSKLLKGECSKLNFVSFLLKNVDQLMETAHVYYYLC